MGAIDSSISLVLWRAGQASRKWAASTAAEWHSLQVGDLSPLLNLEASHSSPSQPTSRRILKFERCSICYSLRIFALC